MEGSDRNDALGFDLELLARVHDRDLSKNLFELPRNRDMDMTL